MTIWSTIREWVNMTEFKMSSIRSDIANIESKLEGVDRRLTRVETRLCKLCEALEVEINKKAGGKSDE